MKTMKKVTKKDRKYELKVWVYDRILCDTWVSRYFAKRPSKQVVKTIIAGVWKEMSNRGVPADLNDNYKYYGTVSRLDKQEA